MEDRRAITSLPPLEWGGGRIRLDCAFLGKTHRFEHDGPFVRIGSDPRCEFCIPGLPAPVCVYLQVGKQYAAVLELVESQPTSLCEPVYAMPGGTVWLQPNARITVEGIEPSESTAEVFSWENFNVEDVRVFPNTLVARTGFYSTNPWSSHLRLQSTLSVLGSSPSCHLRPEHKSVSRFQAIVFRGEHQGESCRVIDLFGAHPTIVDHQPANGRPLEVGSEVRIANLTFEAVRLLYNASRPNHIVEVRSQFSTLPLAQKQESRSASGSEASSSATAIPELQSMKGRLAKAIGFDTGSSRKNRVHFPLEPTVEPAGKSQTESLNDSIVPQLVDGLERITKTQDRLVSEFELMANRLQGVESSLNGLPEILDSNTQQLVDTIETLKGVLERVASGLDANAMQSVSKTAATGPVASNRRISEDPTTAKSAVTTEPNRNATLGNKIDRSSPPKKAGNNQPKVSVATDAKSNPRDKQSNKPLEEHRSKKSPVPAKTTKKSWLERTTTSLSGWLPSSAARRREIAERESLSDPLNLGSQATAHRVRLQHHEDESELLSASESEDETLVLGSLMGLRYRDARKSFLRWTLFATLVAVTMLVGGPLLWKRIPEGWRELIWQKVTLAKPQEDAEPSAPASSTESESPQQPSN